MPLIKYSCLSCGNYFSEHVKKAVEAKMEAPCKKCGAPSKRTLSAPSNSSKIVVDNGVQARSVEVDMKVIESNQENASKGPDRGDA